MIQMKDMLNLFPKIPLYYNIPSKHAEEKCLNADFLTAGRLLQKKCLVVYYSSSMRILCNFFFNFINLCQNKKLQCIDKDKKNRIVETESFSDNK